MMKGKIIMPKRTHKIKVTPEGRDGVWIVEPQEIIKFLKKYKGKKIHNFIQGGPCLIGADWYKKKIIEKISVSDRVALLTGDAQKQNYRHALSVIVNNQLYIFDIGEITENDLQVLII